MCIQSDLCLNNALYCNDDVWSLKEITENMDVLGDMNVSQIKKKGILDKAKTSEEKHAYGMIKATGIKIKGYDYH